MSLATLAPDVAGDEQTVRWWATVERAAGSPRRAVRKQELVFDIDIRHVLSAIAVPTLVVATKGDRYVIPAHSGHLAEHIPGAQLLELPGDGHWPWASPDALASMDAIEEFLTGSRARLGTERILATVAFTDIVGSTELAAELGDRRWRELIRDPRLGGAPGGRAGPWPGREDDRRRDARYLRRSRACDPSGPRDRGSRLRRSGCPSAAACMPARSRCATTTWAGSPSTSGRGSPIWPGLARSSCPRP